MPQVRLSPQATVAKGALMVYLGPRMAADAAIDLHSTLRGVKGKNFRAEAKRVAVDIQKALKGKLAQDADVDDISDVLEEIAEALEAEGSVPVEGEEDDFVDKDAEPYGMTGEGSDNDTPDVIAQIREFVAGKLSPEDQAELDRVISSASSGGNGGEDEEETDEEKAAREAREREEEEMRGRDQRARDRRARDGRGGAADEPPPFKGRPNPGGTMDKKAMDAAIQNERRLQREISAAERHVRPWVGDFAMDEANSPTDIYGAALKMLGVDVEGVHPSAFKVILDRTPKPGTRNGNTGGGSRFAQDAKPAAKSFSERFPSVARIGTV